MENNFIEPTIGRVVWYKNEPFSDQFMDAHICYVNKDGTINISFHSDLGTPNSACDVEMFQGKPEDCPERACCWMPHQKKQAEKHSGETGTSEVGLTD